jgi:mitochondrial distribution and morphology protein 34
MSFTFNWPNFSDQFHYDAIQMLNTALNKGSKPPVMADKIEVVELQMGSQVRSVNHSFFSAGNFTTT